ncbi:MAG: RDD family protein [Gammaproteobacteria bacterium]|nr:MAG: RDD family protein [Gammaproteobacteria bacterium]
MTVTGIKESGECGCARPAFPLCSTAKPATAVYRHDPGRRTRAAAAAEMAEEPGAAQPLRCPPRRPVLAGPALAQAPAPDPLGDRPRAPAPRGPAADRADTTFGWRSVAVRGAGNDDLPDQPGRFPARGTIRTARRARARAAAGVTSGDKVHFIDQHLDRPAPGSRAAKGRGAQGPRRVKASKADQRHDCHGRHQGRPATAELGSRVARAAGSHRTHRRPTGHRTDPADPAHPPFRDRAAGQQHQRTLIGRPSGGSRRRRLRCARPRPDVPMPIAGVFRRLAALAYDLLLVLAILFVGTVLVLPLSGGEAITAAAQGPVAYIYRLYLAALAFGYFGWSWTRGGQTLGMMAWKIRIEGRTGGVPDWRAALTRFGTGLVLVLATVAGLWLLRGPGWSAVDLAGLLLLAPAPGNYLWLWLDRAGGTLQDRLCGSRIVPSAAGTR